MSPRFWMPAVTQAQGPRSAISLALVCSLCMGSLPLAGQGNIGLLKITVLQGEGSLNNIKKKLAQPPVVEVRDESSKPVEGAVVVFTLPFSGAGGKFANGERTYSAKTDAQGKAACAAFTPNEVEGRFNINVAATAGTKKGSVVVPQSNTLAGGLGAGSGGGFPRWILGLAGTGGGVAAILIAKRGGGTSTPAPTPVPPTTITIGSVTVGGPR